MLDTDLMSFGKYSGQQMKTIPKSYFQYLWDKEIISVHKWNKVYNYAKDNELIDFQTTKYKK